MPSRKKKPSRKRKSQRKNRSVLSSKGSKKFYELRRIYKGNAGPIYLVEDEKGQEMVLKRYNYAFSYDKGIDPSLLFEIMILNYMKKVNNQHIMQLKYLNINEKNNMDLIVEKMDGELTDLILQNLDLKKIQNYMYQMVSALYDLHSHGIIHCDIKPKNILYQKLANNTNIKITDFGLSYLMNYPYYHARYVIGTHHYHPPEFKDHRSVGRISFNSDMYSLGVIFYYMINPDDYRRYDHRNDYYYMFNVQQIDWEYVYDRVGETGSDLLKQMLFFNPEERMSSLRALKHDFFSEEKLNTINKSTKSPKSRKNSPKTKPKQEGGRIWEITNLTSSEEYLNPHNHEEFLPIILQKSLKHKYDVNLKQNIPPNIWNLLYEYFEELNLKFITLNYAIYLLFKYASIKKVRQDMWNYLAFACLFLSTKFNEYRLDINISVYHIENKRLILKYERDICETLNYDFQIPIIVTKEIILYKYYMDAVYKLLYWQHPEDQLLMNTYHWFYLLQLLSSLTYFIPDLYRESKDDLARMIMSFMFPAIKHRKSLRDKLINLMRNKRHVYWIERELLDHIITIKN